MKKLLALFTLAISFCSYAETLKFAMEPTYAPFEVVNDKGEYEGFDIDIAKLICKDLNVECEFVSQPFDGLITGLKFKTFDAVISAVDITEERKQQVAFSTPYYDSSASFLAIASKVKEVKDIKTIGVQNGTTFQRYIAKAHPDMAVNSYDTIQAAILDMNTGRIDGLFGDTAALAEWKKTKSELDFVGEKVTDPEFFGIGLGIAVNLENTELLNKINTSLAKIKESNEYKELLNKWFN